MRYVQEALWIACVAIPLGGILYWYISDRREQMGAAYLEQQPLPETATAYIRVGYILTMLSLAAGLTVFLAGLCWSVWQAESLVLAILAPCALLAAVVVVYLLSQLLLRTRVSPWGAPAVRLSPEGVSYKNDWSVPWRDVLQVDFRDYGGGRSFLWYMLLSVKSMPPGAKKDWFNNLGLVRGQPPIKERVLAINLTSTTRALWEYQVLVRKYWCVAHGIAYVPGSWDASWPRSPTRSRKER